MDKKKKKLSRPVKFMILTGCLLLAVCGYALTLKFSEAAEAEEGGEEIAFVSVSEKDIAKISWTYDGEVYSLERNDDGTWIRPDGYRGLHAGCRREYRREQENHGCDGLLTIRA